MAVKSIPRMKFSQLVPQSYLLESVFGDEVAWFADESGRTIGTIVRSERERRWFYIVLERERDGHYQVCNVQSGFESQHLATAHLTHAMAVAGRAYRPRRRVAVADV